jgi:hypothetical protein
VATIRHVSRAIQQMRTAGLTPPPRTGLTGVAVPRPASQTRPPETVVLLIVPLILSFRRHLKQNGR